MDSTQIFKTRLKLLNQISFPFYYIFENKCLNIKDFGEYQQIDKCLNI
jgi:hypothetical protein